MKTFVRLSALACGLFLAGATFAQEKTAPAPQPAPHVAKARAPQDPSWTRMDLSGLNNALHPDATLMGKFKDLDAKYEKQRRELDASLTPEQRANEVKTLMMKRDQEMRALLSPDQTKTYDEYRRAAKAPVAMPEKK